MSHWGEPNTKIRALYGRRAHSQIFLKEVGEPTHSATDISYMFNHLGYENMVP